ncbi:MAG: SDR family oxidoreductase [Gemmatimonadota bacterium]
MNDRDRQRVALVTGAAVRVGRTIALGLANDGYDLVAAYGRSDDEAMRLEGEVRALGRRCALVQADLRTPGGAEQVVRVARETFGSLDAVVNSAASFRRVPLDEVDAAEWDEVMALNVRAAHLVVREALDLLRSSRGSVVNITDLGAFEAWTEYPHHAVSKAALAHLTRVQAKAYAPEVRVNAVAPGAVLAPDDWSDAQWSAVSEQAALRRPGSPADVLDAVRYFLSADFVTGQVLAVDGGRLL